MANIRCLCGYVFSDGQLPCPHAYTLISDENIEAVIDGLEGLVVGNNDIDAQAGFLINSKGVNTYKCPSCSRLLIFDKGLTKQASIYKKEF